METLTLDSTPRLLTEAEAASLLALKPATLRGWRHRGCGPTFRKINGAVRYKAADIDKFIDESAHNSTAENSRPARA